MELTIYTLKSLAQVMVDPYMALILFLLCVFLYRKNKRITLMQKMMVGERFVSPLELTLSQLVLGIIGGIIGSVVLSNLGVMFHENSGIELIFLFSFFLMIIKPRWICFSYSGALLGLLVIAINFFKDSELLKNIYISNISLDVTSLVVLIAVLHIVEGFLIMIDGDRGSIPVFSYKDEKLVGGFAFERYWPIPIAIMLLTSSATGMSGGSIDTPQWWPLLKGDVNMKLMATSIAVMLPVYGVIGYKSVTFTESKKKKVFVAGVFNIVYGAILVAVTPIANFGLAGKIVLLVLMPVMHESMLTLQTIRESKKQAKFVSDDEGVTVLEVSPNSEAFRLGLKTGDKILELNDDKITEYTMIYEAVSDGLKELKLKIKDRQGYIKEVMINIPDGGAKKLGMVLIPKGSPKDGSMVRFGNNNFKDVLDNIRKKK